MVVVCKMSYRGAFLYKLRKIKYKAAEQVKKPAALKDTEGSRLP